MIKVYIKSINYISLNELNISRLPKYRRDKIEKLIFEKDKLLSYCAGVLIDEYISDKEIKIAENGKPYVASGEKFNLSHSGDYAVLALGGDKEVGCDIERIRPLDYMKVGRTVFTDGELKMLQNCDDAADKFFEFWTKKEAVMKYTGQGFGLPAKSIDLSVSTDYLDFNGKRLFFYEYMHNDYKIMICCEKSNVEFNVL